RGGCSDSGIPSLLSTCDGYENGGSGGDSNAAGAVHLARRSPAEGGDSKVSGDGGGVGIARSLSTSTSGERDMERHILMNCCHHHHLHHLLHPWDSQLGYPLPHPPYTPQDPLLDLTQQHTLKIQ
nr:hypothetical protein [Tanacetum cinerariifolium]